MAEEEKPEGEGAVAEGEAPPKKKVSLLVVALGAQLLILLVLSGFIAKAVFLQKPKDFSENRMAERAIAAIRDSDAQIQVVDLETLTLSLGPGKALKTAIQIEVSNPATAELLKKRLPAVRAQVLRALAQSAVHKVDGLRGKLLLKDSIRDALTEVLEKDGAREGTVRDVLLQDFILVTN